jgi:hypothetical protein
MLERALRFAYERLGPRYPRAALALLFALAYVIGLAGVGLLRLYQDMSAGDLLLIAAAVVALVFVENVLAARVSVRLVEPAGAWLSGDRTGRTAVQAWTALAGLPQDFLSTGRWMAVFMNVIPISIFVAWVLELNAYGFAIVAAGAAVCLAYGVLLRFFGMELLMKPVLEDVSCDLPDGSDLGGVRLPLRWKLLVALPAMNVITGVVVSALSAGPGTSDLGDLGWDVLFAVVVSFTISFELVLLLTRSVADQIDAVRRGTERCRTSRSARACRCSPPTRRARSPRRSTRWSPGWRSARACARRSARSSTPTSSTGSRGGDDRPRGRGGRGLGALPRHPRLHRARRALDRQRGRRQAQRLLRTRRPRARAPRRPRQQVRRRRPARRSSAHRSGLVDHADRAVLAALDIARTVHETYGDGSASASASTRGPVLAGHGAAAAATSSSPSSATRSTPPRASRRVTKLTGTTAQHRGDARPARAPVSAASKSVRPSPEGQDRSGVRL